MKKMTNNQMKTLAAVLAVVGVYFLFFRKKKSVVDGGQSQPIEPKIEVEAQKKYKVNTQKDPLNIRSKPDVTSSKVGTLAKGSVFVGAKVKSSNWVEVYEMDNKTIKGYVSADFVVLDSGSGQPQGPSGDTLIKYKVKTAGGNLNVRKSASKTAPIIGQFANGTIIYGKDFPLGSGNSYFEVKLPNGTFGWVDWNFVEKI